MTSQRRTENEVVLRDLAVTDLLGQGVVAVVDISEDVQLVQLLNNLGSVVFLQRRSVWILHL